METLLSTYQVIPGLIPALSWDSSIGGEVFPLMKGLLSMKPWTAAKKIKVSVAVPPAPVRVPSERPLAPSVASITSVS